MPFIHLSLVEAPRPAAPSPPTQLRLAAAGGMRRALLRVVVPQPEPATLDRASLDDLQQAFVDELRELGGMAVVA